MRRRWLITLLLVLPLLLGSSWDDWKLKPSTSLPVSLPVAANLVAGGSTGFRFACPSNAAHCGQFESGTCAAQGYTTSGSPDCTDSPTNNGSVGQLRIDVNAGTDFIQIALSACTATTICEWSAEIRFDDNAAVANVRDTMELRDGAVDVGWLGISTTGINASTAIATCRGEGSLGVTASCVSGVPNNIVIRRYTFQYEPVAGTIKLWVDELDDIPRTGDVLGGSGGLSTTTIVSQVADVLELSDAQNRSVLEFDNLVVCNNACDW